MPAAKSKTTASKAAAKAEPKTKTAKPKAEPKAKPAPKAAAPKAKRVADKPAADKPARVVMSPRRQTAELQKSVSLGERQSREAATATGRSVMLFHSIAEKMGRAKEAARRAKHPALDEDGNKKPVEVTHGGKTYTEADLKEMRSALRDSYLIAHRAGRASTAKPKPVLSDDDRQTLVAEKTAELRKIADAFADEIGDAPPKFRKFLGDLMVRRGLAGWEMKPSKANSIVRPVVMTEQAAKVFANVNLGNGLAWFFTENPAVTPETLAVKGGSEKFADECISSLERDLGRCPLKELGVTKEYAKAHLLDPRKFLGVAYNEQIMSFPVLMSLITRVVHLSPKLAHVETNPKTGKKTLHPCIKEEPLKSLFHAPTTWMYKGEDLSVPEFVVKKTGEPKDYSASALDFIRTKRTAAGKPVFDEATQSMDRQQITSGLAMHNIADCAGDQIREARLDETNFRLIEALRLLTKKGHSSEPDADPEANSDEE